MVRCLSSWCLSFSASSKRRSVLSCKVIVRVEAQSTCKVPHTELGAWMFNSWYSGWMVSVTAEEGIYLGTKHVVIFRGVQKMPYGNYILMWIRKKHNEPQFKHHYGILGLRCLNSYLRLVV